MMTTYQVLARKWRPKKFADLVGQQHVVRALQNALDNGRLHHAYLLTGTRGVGKTTIARILAKSLNCQNSQHGEPCGQCATCCAIDAGRFVDLLEIDAASNTGIDNIREVLENAQYAPTVGKYKVYIIDEVHMLSKSAFNAMLKTLEEPPEHVKFILATTDPHKVPITVLSRCLQFVLRNMTVPQIAEHLAHVLKAEKIVFEPAALTLLARAATGSMRDALSLLDQAIALGSGSVKECDVRNMIGAVDKRYLYELLTFLMEQDGEGLLTKAREMEQNALGWDSVLNELAMLLQKLALLKAVPSAIDPDDPEHEHLSQLSRYFSDEQIQLYYQCIIHGKQDLSLAPDEYAGFVMTLLRLLAFAPFAAKNTPQNGEIEGTQLHNPSENSSPKKVELPENTASCTFRQPEKIPHAQPTSPETEPFSGSVSDATEPDFPPFDTLPSTPPAIFRQPENTHVPLSDHDIFPPLTAENWVNIARLIGSHIAAARLLLEHTAWVHYDESKGELHLAVAQQPTRQTNKKEYFDRIAAALSQAYGTEIHIKIQNLNEDGNRETPVMQRQRIAHEAREHAQQILDSDTNAQKIQQIFSARWLENSLALLSEK